MYVTKFFVSGEDGWDLMRRISGLLLLLLVMQLDILIGSLSSRLHWRRWLGSWGWKKGDGWEAPLLCQQTSLLQPASPTPSPAQQHFLLKNWGNNAQVYDIVIITFVTLRPLPPTVHWKQGYRGQFHILHWMLLRFCSCDEIKLSIQYFNLV